MSAESELTALAVRHGVPGLLLRAGLDAYRAEVLREAAAKQRALMPDNGSEMTWQRHILYGMAGQTFEAQAALDAFEAAYLKDLTDLIDPDKEPS